MTTHEGYKKTNDGGPAFPSVSEDGSPGTYGMSLRDYFAAKYLAGIMACPIEGSVGTPSDVAFEAYLHADAMSEERGE